MGEPAAQEGLPAAASLDGESLLRAFAGGTDALRRQADAINAINVFPVPDGDTGTNMSLTMRAALDEAQRAAPHAGAVAAAAAHGSLMGAKGNSGVILSQILGGLATVARPHDTLGARLLAEGLERGREAAYRVVSRPREGTILTAITAAAHAAQGEAQGGNDALATLDAAVAACEDAVRRTPDLLPVLKEAGVVDSGAQGLFVLLEGMARALRCEEAAEHAGGFGAIDVSWLEATRRLHDRPGAASGFCTEFAISGNGLDEDAIKARMNDLGNSLIVASEEGLVRVHVHTPKPEDALAYARSLGEVVHEKVEDMEAQFRDLAGRATRAPSGLGVVAVGAGNGIEELMESLGASVVRGGQTMNPSAGDIRDAILAAAAADVIVLPNNKNIVMAARQAGEGLDRRVHVIETQSVPQGIAALVALNTETSLEENIESMTDAAESLHHAEVTFAARATRIHGLDIREGQPIGIVDGDLTVAEETVEAAVRAAVERMASGREGALVTLYVGAGVDDDAVESIAESLRGELGVEVEVVPGGQPHYPFFIGVE